MGTGWAGWARDGHGMGTDGHGWARMGTDGHGWARMGTDGHGATSRTRHVHVRGHVRGHIWPDVEVIKNDSCITTQLVF
jgi:hypothetical protein